MLFGCFCRKFYHADLDSREQQAILLKKVEIQAKIAFFLFSRRKIWHDFVLSRRSRLSRTSRIPSRLIRPRLTDCDAGRDRQMKILPGFWPINFSNIAKKSVLSRPASSFDLHPKRSPQPDFLDWGVSIRVTSASKKIVFWGGQLVATNISITRRRSGGRGRAVGAGRLRAGRPARGGRRDSEVDPKTVVRSIYV